MPAATAQQTCSLTVEIQPRNQYDDAPSWPTAGVDVSVVGPDGVVKQLQTGTDGIADFGQVACGTQEISFPTTTALRPSTITLPVTDPTSGEVAYAVTFHPKPRTVVVPDLAGKVIEMIKKIITAVGNNIISPIIIGLLGGDPSAVTGLLIFGSSAAALGAESSSSGDNAATTPQSPPTTPSDSSEGLSQVHKIAQSWRQGLANTGASVIGVALLGMVLLIAGIVLMRKKRKEQADEQG